MADSVVVTPLWTLTSAPPTSPWIPLLILRDHTQASGVQSPTSNPQDGPSLGGRMPERQENPALWPQVSITITRFLHHRALLRDPADTVITGTLPEILFFPSLGCLFSFSLLPPPFLHQILLGAFISHLHINPFSYASREPDRTWSPTILLSLPSRVAVTWLEESKNAIPSALVSDSWESNPEQINGRHFAMAWSRTGISFRMFIRSSPTKHLRWGSSYK